MTNRLIRIMPILLVKDNYLCKGKGFKNYKYVGDIYNAVKIFSEKKAQELIILNIDNNYLFDINILKKIRNEIFVPLTIGGGIKNLDDISTLIDNGAEKVSLNSIIFKKKKIIYEAAKKYGSQSVVVSVDVKKIDNNYYVYKSNGNEKTEIKLNNYIKEIEQEGAGEILLTSIDKEGSKNGYELDLLKKLQKIVKIPIIANGGAGSLNDLEKLFNETTISAAGVGTMFVFFGKNDAVLINYPEAKIIENLMDKYEKFN